MPLAVAPEPIAVGTVRAVIAEGSRALVALEDGRMVTICREQVAPLVPLDRVLAVGMQVHGLLDPTGTELRLHLETPSTSMLDAMFPDGVVTPALVTKVGELGGELALHPGLLVRISRSDVSTNPRDRIDGLLEVGETVAARISRHSDGSIRLRLLDVDDDEPVQSAMSLLPSGPEWLVFPPDPEEEFPAADAAVPDSPAAETPLTPLEARTALQHTQLALVAERAENARLRSEIAAARATSPEEMRAVVRELGEALHERDLLGEQVKALRIQVADLKKANRDRETAAPIPGRRREDYPDLETWIRHRITFAWMERCSPAERTTYPLPDYVIGGDFAESLEVLDEDRLEKAFRACVDVLTGRAESIAARAVHALRTDESGGSPQVVREDGARAWRCAIENHTASARRLHWWRLRTGGLELSRIVLHDDVTP